MEKKKHGEIEECQLEDISSLFFPFLPRDLRPSPSPGRHVDSGISRPRLYTRCQSLYDLEIAQV